MATVEKTLSQEFHETAEGVTLLRRFDSTYADYNTGSASFRTIPYSVLLHPFPYRIGDALDYDGLAFPITTNKTATMRITDIELIPVDNENIIVEIFYSTAIPTVVQKMQPDTNASWQENFQLNSVVTNTDTWIASSAVEAVDKFVTRADRKGVKQDWNALWTASGNTSEKPEATLYEPAWVFTATTYSRVMLINRLFNQVDSVNSGSFMNQYFADLATRNGIPLVGGVPSLNVTDLAIEDANGDIFDDTGRWLFTGVNTSRARFDSWQYDWEFTFNLRWRWNEPYGITVDKYPISLFTALFAGMTGAPEEDNQGGIRA